MRPLTENRPKVLLPVAGEPLVHRILRQLSAAGVDHATLVVNYRQAAVRASVGDGSAFGLTVEYAEQKATRGTGDAVLAGHPPETEPFLVLNGDLFLDDDAIPSLVASGPGSVAAAIVEDARAYGVFRTSADDRALEVVEKSAEPPSTLANAGLYFMLADFPRHLRALKESPRGELELTDALNASFRDDRPYEVVRLPRWLDVGRPWDLLAATARALDDVPDSRVLGIVEPGATIHGTVVVGEGSVVKAGAYVEGPVFIGRDSTVGPNCYLRPYSAIGDRCKVGNACEIKASLLMDGTHVGHLSYVGDSVLGERVNLGAGTLVANLRHDNENVKVRMEDGRVDSGRRKMGVVLGDDVHTGINSSLNVGVVLGAGVTTKPGDVVMSSRFE